MAELTNETVTNTSTEQAKTHQSVHELNFYQHQKLDALSKVLKSAAPELLEKVLKENSGSEPGDVIKALVKEIRKDINDPNGRLYGVGQIYAATNPEVVAFMKETTDTVSPGALKLLTILADIREKSGDKSAVQGLSEYKEVLVDEKKYQSDLALRTALEKALPGAAGKLVEAGTEEATKSLLNTLREEIKKNPIFTSGTHGDEKMIRQFLNSDYGSITPGALIALSAYTATNATPGLSLAGKGQEIQAEIDKAAELRGWKYKSGTREYADVGNLSYHEQGFYENRQSGALGEFMKIIAPEALKRVEAQNLEGRAKIEAFVIEFRKELQGPMRDLGTVFSQLDPEVAKFLQQTGGEVSKEFMSTMSRFANNQAAWGNNAALTALEGFREQLVSGATYDADLNVRKVLEVFFPKQSADATAAGQGTYEAMGSLIGNLRDYIKTSGGILLTPFSGSYNVVQSFLQSDSNDINAESLGALRALVTTRSTPPFETAGKVAEFNAFLDAAAAQRGLRWDNNSFSYKA